MNRSSLLATPGENSGEADKPLRCLCCPVGLACSPGQGWCVVSSSVRQSCYFASDFFCHLPYRKFYRSRNKSSKTKNLRAKVGWKLAYGRQGKTGAGRWLDGTYQTKGVKCQDLGTIPFCFVTVTRQTRGEDDGLRGRHCRSTRGLHSYILFFFFPWTCTDSSTCISPWSQQQFYDVPRRLQSLQKHSWKLSDEGDLWFWSEAAAGQMATGEAGDLAPEGDGLFYTN